ncbi:annexin A3 [Heteronotia binoei]|uniref:annexin A3 n=1 Tax=Heteronotia binoei TaxID=13085 RepID=UPI0029317754|nr:annexin A3 [Heteronotia binoei]XP_060103130.1 annexin A3 [Heteronotia binoei]XP_060103131.1 annexin A3 [Heteronotia binoei]
MATSAWVGNRGTIPCASCFDPANDAALIQKAMKGIGTDEKTLIDIIANRSNAQRQVIAGQYKMAAGKDLREALKAELSGHLEDIIVALVTPPAVYDAEQLNKAMQGAGTDEKTLIEILASRNNKQMREVAQAYYKIYNKSLESDISADTSGDFQKALLVLADNKRNESPIVDAHLGKSDAQILYEAGEKKWGTDEDKFTEILCLSSLPQLKHTFTEYQKLSGKSIEDSIRREMSGDYEDLLLAIVKCVKSIPAFFAEKLRGALKGAGTDERTLNRILVSRSELDLLDIRAEYKKLYGHSLYSAIQSDTSGDYRTALLKICGGND